MTWLDNHERIFELIETRYELHPPKAADMVAVIRCRDCKFFATNIHGSYCKKSITTLSDSNGFCAWGERKEGVE